MTDEELIDKVKEKIAPLITGAVTRARDAGYAEAKAEAKEALDALRFSIMREMNKEQADHNRYANIAALISNSHKGSI